jgi:hypothetical protein
MIEWPLLSADLQPGMTQVAIVVISAECKHPHPGSTCTARRDSYCIMGDAPAGFDALINDCELLPVSQLSYCS